ncbi:MAG TPA: hypothetical protein VFY73_20920 [Ideonella sp.]|uniref:hypothetical protein n=1 Tax=Ideonella sp. TaxID=1929293 RepID=UPI002E3616ED|nr:hypothetical protein [Ideonella sp.]HEX5686499.1 hypothetical protein [Ideonella sp.]
MNINLSRRRSLVRALAAGAGAALAGCTGLMGAPRVAYGEAELNQMLGRRFPLERRVLEALDLSLANPRLTLRPEAARLATEFDLLARDRVFGHSWRGQLALDYGLRFERSDNSLRLVGARVTRLTLDKGGGAQAERIGALVIEQMLADTVIHRLKPEQIDRLTQAGYELGEVKVTVRGVEIDARPRR